MSRRLPDRVPVGGRPQGGASISSLAVPDEVRSALEWAEHPVSVTGDAVAGCSRDGTGAAR
jgi:hypothetical protein